MSVLWYYSCYDTFHNDDMLTPSKIMSISLLVTAWLAVAWSIYWNLPSGFPSSICLDGIC